jgi:hypothetical protein
VQDMVCSAKSALSSICRHGVRFPAPRKLPQWSRFLSWQIWRFSVSAWDSGNAAEF